MLNLCQDVTQKLPRNIEVMRFESENCKQQIQREFSPSCLSFLRTAPATTFVVNRMHPSKFKNMTMNQEPDNNLQCPESKENYIRVTFFRFSSFELKGYNFQEANTLIGKSWLWFSTMTILLFACFLLIAVLFKENLVQLFLGEQPP